MSAFAGGIQTITSTRSSKRLALRRGPYPGDGQPELNNRRRTIAPADGKGGDCVGRKPQSKKWPKSLIETDVLDNILDLFPFTYQCILDLRVVDIAYGHAGE